MNKIIGIIIALLLIAGGVYFFVSGPADDSEEHVENDTGETEEPAGEESSEETTEPDTEKTAEESSSEEETVDESTEEDTHEKTEAETEEAPSEEDSTEPGAGENTSGNNYTAAEQCIMSELTECEGVPTADRFQAYKDLVRDGTLPQAPGSGCLPCAVKYSFEVKYGESRDIEAELSEGPQDDQTYTDSPEALITTYLFSLPEYYNGANERTLDYMLPGSDGYNQLVDNKASGIFRDHMTYSVFIEEVETVSDGRYNVFASREYSHENSGGVHDAYVKYEVVERDGQYYINSYDELSNVPVE